MSAADNRNWTTIGDMLKAVDERRMWALSRGEQRRLVIADDEVSARAQVPDGETWRCKRFRPDLE